jgi:hypothetical protein
VEQLRGGARFSALFFSLPRSRSYTSEICFVRQKRQSNRFSNFSLQSVEVCFLHRFGIPLE